MDRKRLWKAVKRAFVSLLITLMISILLVVAAVLLKWWFVALFAAALVVFAVWEEYMNGGK